MSKFHVGDRVRIYELDGSTGSHGMTGTVEEVDDPFYDNIPYWVRLDDGQAWHCGEDELRPADIVALIEETKIEAPTEVPGLTRSEVLSTAADLVDGERARTYGDAGENFRRIGQFWSPILGLDVTAVQVALCLTQLKIARLVSSSDHADSWIDAAGYIALGGEIATRGDS